MTTLSLEHLSKTYDGRTVVDDVNFSIAGGEIFGLLGPNGAGKTTTMSIVSGLIAADAGQVTLDGVTLEARAADRRHILGLVPQELAIYPELSGRENLSFFGSLHGFTQRELRQRVERVLEQIGLTEHANRAAGTYSGGMKRRLNFGAAILHDPLLVILDEPTVGVDPQSRSHLLEVVRGLGNGDKIVIYASHYMEEVESVCGRAAIMDHGKVIVCDWIAELLKQVDPAMTVDVIGWNAAAAERLGDRTTVTATATGHQLRIHGSSEAGIDERGRELSRVLAILCEAHVTICRVETQDASLEQLFLKLTGRTLRD